MKYCFLVLLIVTNLFAQVSANLLVSPTRVVFEGRERTEDIVLINTTSNERSYRIEWSEKAVNERGKYIAPTKILPDYAASEYIRFAPRQVTLQPGERQVVKLMLRRKNSMDLPEYRSHITFTALPLRETETETETESTQQGASFKINVLTSYSVPVMVRTAAPDIKVEIDNISIKKMANGNPVIQVTLSKTGLFSANGSFYVYFQGTEEQGERKVGILNGVNFFHEASVLRLELPWQDYTGPTTGTLRAEYVGKDELAGTTLANFAITITPSDF